MARYRGPKCRLSRRVGMDLENKSGVKPIDQKCKFEQSPGKPAGRRARGSDYGIQLNMKQTIRYYYDLSEKQFRNLYKKADKASGSTGDNLLVYLEARLDNIVYRLGLASTRSEARQMVRHGHIAVNSKRVDIPSYSCLISDEISVIEKFRKHERVTRSIQLSEQKEMVSWLAREKDQFIGKVNDFADPAFFAEMFKVNLVIELYSK
ncbi:MAG: 30S ribosomal protein S4 [Gammaproteobacteria bacterium]|nr:30S ribosomal protein S4 [Gammaproteobacteria bacterium]